ncbi:MAG: HAMP domain-containing sensor histidine kinase, partial [Bacteroidota bacterium]
RASFARRVVFFKVMLLLIFISVLVVLMRGLIKTIKKQKYLSDVRDDFIDSLTHEFKTPIATVSAAIESMQNFNALENRERAARYLAMSKSELERLDDMVTKLLSISLYDKNDFKLELQTIDITAIINEVLSIEKLRADKPVFYKVDIDDSVNAINGDALHLKNVLINLIDNAIKYSKKHEVNISITGMKRKSTACFSIKDDGNGIPGHELDYIFDKFYRVPTNDRYLVKGSGLGLSYVRSVIEAHGGNISVNSEVNEYTEFVISIPLR